MEKLYVYPDSKIGPGSHLIDIDIEWHKRAVTNAIESGDCKIRGANDLNRFAKIPDQSRATELNNILDSMMGIRMDWTWEYFHSGEPAGLHTDYTSETYAHPKNPDTKDSHTIKIAAGVIIPLEWNTKGCVPYTVNYDRMETSGSKLNYTYGEMRHVKNLQEIVHYRPGDWKDWHWDPEVLKYHPIASRYVTEFAGLKVHSAYTWEKNTMMLFDPARWHSSSWFLSSKHLPASYEQATEYKRAIVGFGTITIHHNIHDHMDELCNEIL
tara:strand:+ start:1871 stop:2674 length:804 start_codon:yes stop_codon:yes gene_type:complete